MVVLGRLLAHGGGYRAELEITERWRDSTSPEWQVARGRALAALGREREVTALLKGSTTSPIGSVASRQLTIATELAVHGHPRAARALAESIWPGSRRILRPRRLGAEEIAWANRLLGRSDHEQAALERIAGAMPTPSRS